MTFSIIISTLKIKIMNQLRIKARFKNVRIVGGLSMFTHDNMSQSELKRLPSHMTEVYSIFVDNDETDETDETNDDIISH